MRAECQRGEPLHVHVNVKAFGAGSGDRLSAMYSTVLNTALNAHKSTVQFEL